MLCDVKVTVDSRWNR